MFPIFFGEEGSGEQLVHAATIVAAQSDIVVI